MKKISVIVLLMLSFISLHALEVTTSILPQKYFIEKIAQDKVKVNVMVKKGFSPATYEPKTSQMKKLASSTLYFSIGVPFEQVWLERFKSANSSLVVIDTAKGIQKRTMPKHTHHEEDAHEEDAHEGHDHDEHAHEEEKEHHDQEHHEDEEEHHDAHEHGGLDPHVWLDPILVKVQAKNIYKALVKYDAKNSAFYQKNYEDFIQELDRLYSELKNVLKPVEHKAFMVFHPSWGYFAQRFDLEQIAVEVEGKEPKPNQLVELIEEAKEHEIKIVFVAPQFSQKSAKVIAQNIKGNVVVIDPLNESWYTSMIETAQAIVKSYQ
ncbi:metal ABC transporter solute-binding protein, Zn/Mn family [Candidatus Marinarcus aquaticus]|uniref:Cation ABC transporter substrate-binding protein n=1 Tax=Candidatus Marinarcus aquaticus TaxID=2044504 RepID=A0A4Q0XSY4_9BACT|nr:zinc ABC transporter substrate-binding protein [Candidatus Marinarcus aquaticus]RXJ60590.1 cation ABC transporter substrate-binding protein [Candidatus Marinarcus aquaticus]